MAYSRAQKESIYRFTHTHTEIADLEFDLGVLPELIEILGAEQAEAEFEVLVDLFLANLSFRLLEVELAYANQDWSTLFRLCHNFRVLANNVGGSYVSWLAGQMAETIKQPQCDQECFKGCFEQLLRAFYRECDRLKQHLE
ncbi:MAG: hypothetical protein SFT94_03395 [Pseudanabaenaceae cyanobacterium bins.68]|nr:hypothetical protein [Pseudanabaenaceae cyanobacterium bins.68]